MVRRRPLKNRQKKVIDDEDGDMEVEEAAKTP